MSRSAQANPSTSQSNTALITAKASRHIVIKAIYISSDTAMTVSLVNGTTHDLIFRQYVGATGGTFVPIDGLVSSKTGEGIDYSTSSNGNVYIKVLYGYSDGL